MTARTNDPEKRSPRRPLVRLLCVFLFAGAFGLAGCKTKSQPSLFKPGPGAAPPPASRVLAVKLRPQLRTNWCWAASGEMVMETLGHDVSQCVQADDMFGKACCPSNEVCNEQGCPDQDLCNDTAWPRLDKYSFTFKRTNSAALDWDQVLQEIGVRGVPIAFTWLFPDGTGHMMVLKGYSTVDGVNYVYVDDPWYAPEPGKPNQGREEYFTYHWYVKDPEATNCDAPDGQRLGDHCAWDNFYDFSHP